MARAYRKRPVVVEAVQWTGENHGEMCEFIDPEVFEITSHVGLVIHTLEGDHHASPGDYIIKGVNGEFYPCKPDVFEKTYEPATLTPPNEWVSVEERLPRVGGNYICAVQDKNGYAWTITAEWSLEMKTWFGAFGEIKNKVTHWMYLPEPYDRRPPEGEEETL